VVREAQHARYRIGLAGQNAAVDELLSGRANLAMVGRLYHLSPRLAGRRADELLERFDLTEAGRRPVKTYSGGMRRRLDLAASLLVAPPVLFLDMIADLVTRGTTVLLTTQYLDEADRLADQIVLLHHGKVAAAGTPTQLKSSVGGEQVDVVLRERQQVPEAVRAVRQATGAEPEVRVEECRLTVPVEGGAAALIRVARALDVGAIAIDDIALRHPTLDEVFLRLTARPDLSRADSPRFRASDTVEVSR
jgi:ABC-2 type transport system ATP-binding protein